MRTHGQLLYTPYQSKEGHIVRNITSLGVCKLQPQQQLHYIWYSMSYGIYATMATF